MTIEILHNRECRVWKGLHSELKRWLRTWGMVRNVKVKTVLVKDDDEARERKFFGSPQILIEGRDIDRAADKVARHHAQGCRLYAWESKIYDYPPREMLEEAILRRINYE